MKIPGTNILKTIWQSLLPAEKTLVAGLCLVLLIVRIFFLLRFPLHPDEVATFIHFMSKGVWRSMTYYPFPNNHILYSILGSLVYYVTHNSYWAMRLPAMLISTFFTPVIFLVLKRITNFKTAFLATGLFCFSGLGMYYSFHGRGYFLLTVCSLFTAIGLWEFVRNNNQKALFGFGLASVIGFYTIPTFLYPFVSLLVWASIVLLQKRDFRSWYLLMVAGMITGLVVLLLYGPVIYYNGVSAIIGNRDVVSLGQAEFKELFLGWYLQLQNQLVGREPNGYFITLFFITSLVVFIGWKLKSKESEYFDNADLEWAWLLLTLEVIFLILLRIQVVLPPPRVFIYLAIFQFAGIAWLFVKGIIRLRLKNYSLSICLLVLLGYGLHQVRALENYRVLKQKIYNEMPAFISIALAQKPGSMFIQHDYYNLFTQYAFLENNLKARIDYIPYSPGKPYELVVFRKEKAIPETVKKNYREIYRDDFIIAFKKR